MDRLSVALLMLCVLLMYNCLCVLYSPYLPPSVNFSFLSVCQSVCLCFFVFVCMCVCVCFSVCVFVFLPVSVSFRLSLFLSFFLFAWLYVCLCCSFCLCVPVCAMPIDSIRGVSRFCCEKNRHQCPSPATCSEYSYQSWLGVSMTQIWHEVDAHGKVTSTLQIGILLWQLAFFCSTVKQLVLACVHIGKPARTLFFSLPIILPVVFLCGCCCFPLCLCTFHLVHLPSINPPPWSCDFGGDVMTIMQEKALSLRKRLVCQWCQTFEWPMSLQVAERLFPFGVGCCGATDKMVEVKIHLCTTISGAQEDSVHLWFPSWMPTF